MSALNSNPYELWNTRRSLGVMREVQPEYENWLPFFTNQINSTDEYIDFEKMPIMGRKLAPYVMPLARGKPIYNDRTTVSRFKPAYVKLEDQIDPLMPLVKRAGIDMNFLAPETLTPNQRRDLIRAAMTQQHLLAIRRRWNHMAAMAVINGAITISGENYPSVTLDFQRASNHTITLGSGSKFGDSGVSIVDFFQLVVDRMSNAAFGAVPIKATMGGGVWAVMRKDAEVLKHLDKNTDGGNITVERGLVSGAKVFKAGQMIIGGGSGQVIELWVDNSTYTDDSGSEVRYVGSSDIVFTGSPESLMGYRCFGRIIDPRANYEALEVFPSNWTAREGDIEVEYITHKSAPLMVPINPNTTLKATVL